MVPSIRVSRVSRVGRVKVTLTVTVRVSRVSVMVSVGDSVKYHCEYGTLNSMFAHHTISLMYSIVQCYLQS